MATPSYDVFQVCTTQQTPVDVKHSVIGQVLTNLAQENYNNPPSVPPGSDVYWGTPSVEDSEGNPVSISSVLGIGGINTNKYVTVAADYTGIPSDIPDPEEFIIGENTFVETPNTIVKYVALDASSTPIIEGDLSFNIVANYGPFVNVVQTDSSWNITFDQKVTYPELAVALNAQDNNSTGLSLTTVAENVSFNTTGAMAGLAVTGAGNQTQFAKYFTENADGSLTSNNLTGASNLAGMSAKVNLPTATPSEGLFGTYKFEILTSQVDVFQDPSGSVTDQSGPYPVLLQDGSAIPTSLTVPQLMAMIPAGQTITGGWTFTMDISGNSLALPAGYYIDMLNTGVSTDNSNILNDLTYMSANLQNQPTYLDVSNAVIVLQTGANGNSGNLTLMSLDTSVGETLNYADAATNGQVKILIAPPTDRTVTTDASGGFYGETAPTISVLYSAAEYSSDASGSVIATDSRVTQDLSYNVVYLSAKSGNDPTAAANSNGASLYTDNVVVDFESYIDINLPSDLSQPYDFVNIQIKPTNTVMESGKMYIVSSDIYSDNTNVNYDYTNYDYLTNQPITTNYYYSTNNYNQVIGTIANITIDNIHLDEFNRSSAFDNYRILAASKTIDNLNLSSTSYNGFAFQMGSDGTDAFLQSSALTLSENIFPTFAECQDLVSDPTKSMGVTISYNDVASNANPSYLFDSIDIAWNYVDACGNPISATKHTTIDEINLTFNAVEPTSTVYTDVTSLVSGTGKSNYTFVQVVVDEYYSTKFLVPMGPWNNLYMETPVIHSTTTYYQIYPRYGGVQVVDGQLITNNTTQASQSLLPTFTIGGQPLLASEVIVNANDPETPLTASFILNRDSICALNAKVQAIDLDVVDPIWQDIVTSEPFSQMDVYFGTETSFTFANPVTGSGNVTVHMLINPEFTTHDSLLSLNNIYYVIPLKQEINPFPAIDFVATASVEGGSPIVITDELILVPKYIYNGVDTYDVAAIDYYVYYGDPSNNQLVARVVTAGPFVDYLLNIVYARSDFARIYKTLGTETTTYDVAFTFPVIPVDAGVFLTNVQDIVVGNYITFTVLPDRAGVAIVGTAPGPGPITQLVYTDPSASTLTLDYYRGYDLGMPTAYSTQIFTISRTPGVMQFVVVRPGPDVFQSTTARYANGVSYNINNLVDSNSNNYGDLGLVFNASYSYNPNYGAFFRIPIQISASPVTFNWGNDFQPTDWSGSSTTSLATYGLFTQFATNNFYSGKVIAYDNYTYRITYYNGNLRVSHTNSFIGAPASQTYTQVPGGLFNFAQIKNGAAGINFTNALAEYVPTSTMTQPFFKFTTTLLTASPKTAYFVYAKPYLKFTELSYDGASDVLFNIPSAQYDATQLITQYLPVETPTASYTDYYPFATVANMNNVQFEVTSAKDYSAYATSPVSTVQTFDITGSWITIDEGHNTPSPTDPSYNLIYDGYIRDMPSALSDPSGSVYAIRNPDNSYSLYIKQDVTPIMDTAANGVVTLSEQPFNLLVNIGNSVLPSRHFVFLLHPLEGTIVSMYTFDAVLGTDGTNPVPPSQFQLTRFVTEAVDYRLLPAVYLSRVKLIPRHGAYAIYDMPSALQIATTNRGANVWAKMINNVVIDWAAIPWQTLSGDYTIETPFISLNGITPTPLSADYIIELLSVSPEIPLKMNTFYLPDTNTTINCYGLASNRTAFNGSTIASMLSTNTITLNPTYTNQHVQGSATTTMYGVNANISGASYPRM
jgi:hypothetical protein